MMSALIVERPTLAVAHRDTVFTDRSGYARARYDVMPDGRFLMVRRDSAIAEARIGSAVTWIANWPRLMERSR